MGFPALSESNDLALFLKQKNAHIVKDPCQILPALYLYLHKSWSIIANAMAPSFNDLTEDNGTYDSDEEIDFSGAPLSALFKRLWLTSTKI